jgi:hypothetical protein
LLIREERESGGSNLYEYEYEYDYDYDYDYEYGSLGSNSMRLTMMPDAGCPWSVVICVWFYTITDKS